VKEIVVLTAKLPRTAPPLRILLVSDLHLGATSSDSTVRRVVQLAREAYPDLLLSAGDLLDSAQPGTVPWLDLFRSLEPPLGKYAVLGNHECYAGAGLALDRLEQAGFRVLRQETATVAPGVRLVGVDDPAVHTFSRLALPTEADVLARSRNAGGFTLLLKHQPRVTVAARNGMDLQLSGHTHAGQIAPFGAIVSLFNPYPCGQLIRLSDSLSLYVSPGTGTWGPPFRVLARPELTLLVLRGR
jgi:predicted MPP superfamily phosphohydrolase